MSVRFTSNSFPVNSDTKDRSGIPWGCVVQPFLLHPTSADLAVTESALAAGDEVARCDQCYAYINAYCLLDRYSWRCSLCHAVNSFADASLTRYGNPSRISQLPELSSSEVVLDVTAASLSVSTGDVEEDGSRDTYFDRPVYIAMVDCSGSEEYLEVVKSALTAALEALNPNSLFGLVTFSSKVSLYDVQSTLTVVKQVGIPGKKEDSLPLQLSEVMPLRSFLAEVQSHKESIVNALETLSPSGSVASESVGVQQAAGGTSSAGKRGFGPALEAVLQYLSGGDKSADLVAARVLTFLSGIPDLGLGALDASRYRPDLPGSEEVQEKGALESALLVQQTDVYQGLAELAVQSGVCVDLFALSGGEGHYIDLATLRPLTSLTGGSLYLYNTSYDDASLPQDMYRLLTRPCATAGVLRLRCSPTFKAVRAHGNLLPDTEYEDVYHIVSCDAFHTVAFDLDFTSKQGFALARADRLPTVQLAFQYTVYVHNQLSSAGNGIEDGDGDGDDSKSKHGCEYGLRRRLAIRTYQLTVAQSVRQLYESVDTEAILTILIHKVIDAVTEDGLVEGRLLLHDWLVILTSQYNDEFSLARFGQPLTVPQLDVAFTKCTQLQSLPRLVFSLLRSPLLKYGSEHVHPDVRLHLLTLYSALDPSSLQRSIYPLLSSYSTPDKPAFPRHSLSRAALITSATPIFLLDTFTTLIVYYASSAASSSLPFPPPHSSLLRTTINKLKQERSITPRLVMIRGGVDNASLFEQYLLEEQDVDGDKGNQGAGFVTFLERVAADVKQFMN